MKNKHYDGFGPFYKDIERELRGYRKHFKGATVYCNCDDHEHSTFYEYFLENFNALGLKRILVHRFEARGSKLTIYDSEGQRRKPLKNGHYQHDECLELLKEADIVVTSPAPGEFSNMLTHLIEHKKKFIILGAKQRATHLDTFPHFVNDKVWLGMHSRGVKFYQKLGVGHVGLEQCKNATMRARFFKQRNSYWYTNIEHEDRYKGMLRFRSYFRDTKRFPTFDNVEAINCKKIEDLPRDYDGMIAISPDYLERHSPLEFKIIGCSKIDKVDLLINGDRVPMRIFVEKVA